MKGVDAAVFDLGGVVVEVDEAAGLRLWARAAGLAPEEMAARFRLDGEHERLQRGEIDGREYHAHVSGLLGVAMSYDDFLAGWNAVFGAIYGNALAFIAGLGKTARVVALSNTNHMHAEFWPSVPGMTRALEVFEKVFLSHQIGARKPEPEAYRAVLDWLGVPAGRVAFFDDFEENVAAARRLGMRGFVVRQPCDFGALTG